MDVIAYFKTGLTGGTIDDLDSIDGDVLSDKDFALIMQAGIFSVYIYDADSGIAESVPDVIEPISNAGDGRWILQPSASSTAIRKGIARFSTLPESVSGTDSDSAVTPEGLTSRLAAPGEIGGSTPGDGFFDALEASTIKISSGAAVDSILVSDADGDLTYTGVAEQTILGRITGGHVDDLSASQVRTLINVSDGANAYVHPNHSGDVTSVADGAQNIAAKAVTLAKMADMATSSILGRVTAEAGVPEVLSAATVKTLLAIAQADVSGLNTSDSPTFAGLTLSGLSLSGIVHNSAAGLLSTSAIVNADLGNLGTAGTIPKFGATGLADSLLFETANGIQLYPGKQLLLPATGGFAYDGLFMGDFAGNIYAGLQSLNNVAGNYLYFANGRKFAYLTGWADTTAGALPGGMFLVLNNTFNFSSFAAGSINPIVRMYLNASGYLGLGTTDSGTTEPESVFQIGKRDASDVVDSPSPYINIIGSNVDTTPEKMLRLMRKGHMTGTIQVNATADFNLSSWGAGGAGDVYRGRAKLDINLKNDTATYDWTETADEKVLSLYSDGRVALPTDGAILKFGADEEVALTHIHNVGLGFADSYSLVFGTGNDASIKYDGTNLIINPKLVGTGFLSILGDISLLDEDIILGTTTGTKIGTATNQKLGFYNATPVDQPATVSDPSGGAVVDAEARTAINAIIDRLQELGLIA